MIKKGGVVFFFTLCKFSKLACAHVNINSPLSLYLWCCKHRPFDQVEGLILRVLACLWAYSNFGSQVKPIGERVLACLWAYSNFGSQVKPIGDPSWICRSVSSPVTACWHYTIENRGGGALRYAGVHMGEQQFWNIPLNTF